MAALAVAAIVAGWALAQQPLILPRLTVAQAAAPHNTLVLVVVAVVAGAAILFPSLALLFTITFRGTGRPAGRRRRRRPGPVSRCAITPDRPAGRGRAVHRRHRDAQRGRRRLVRTSSA